MGSILSRKEPSDKPGTIQAGTATKMILNMLTTASMVRLGKTYRI
jgi:N-acetylmuramic acid 6-phosphate (MurNAc-6-P) etherase